MPLPPDFDGRWACFPLQPGEAVVSCSEQDVTALLLDGLIDRSADGGYVLGRRQDHAAGEADGVTRIFVVCTPKSGSSFVVTLLQTVTGFGHLRPVLGGRPMLEADPHQGVIESWPQPSVSQLHCHAKPGTLELCTRLSIRPIFLTRNIFDSLLSMKEYIDTLPHRDLFSGYYTLTSEDERRAYLVNVYAPIVVRIVAGWYAAWKDGTVPIHWCTYEDFFADPLPQASHMLRHLGLDHPDARIEEAIAAAREDKATTKFNKGVPGRGMASFAAEEQRRVLDLIDSYRGLDAREAGLLA